MSRFVRTSSSEANANKDYSIPNSPRTAPISSDTEASSSQNTSPSGKRLLGPFQHKQYVPAPLPKPSPTCKFTIGFAEDPNPRFRIKMEDTHSLAYDFAGVPGDGFFAIYDGHGGNEVAIWCADNLHTILEGLLPESHEKVTEEIFEKTYMQADEAIRHIVPSQSGCTAVTSLLRTEVNDDSIERRILYTANVGDARAVLCRKDGSTVRLTYDHKSSDKIEQQRVRAAGGFIIQERVGGVLAVSRALGDFDMKEFVSAHPYTSEVELCEETDEFIILACDGVWDVYEDDQAAAIVKKELTAHGDPSKAAEKLLSMSLEEGSTDNISIIVVKLI